MHTAECKWKPQDVVVCVHVAMGRGRGCMGECDMVTVAWVWWYLNLCLSVVRHSRGPVVSVQWGKGASQCPLHSDSVQSSCAKCHI